MVDVLTLGETMAALRASGPVQLGGQLDLSVAGAEFNVAVGLSRLAHSVAWVGAVGDDEFGALILRTLRAEGVRTDYSRVAAGERTGIVMFEPRISGITRVWYRRDGSAGASLGPAEVERAMASATPRIVHLTGITPALGESPRQAVDAAVAAASNQGCLVSLDVNYRKNLWSAHEAKAVLSGVLPHVDVLFASDEEFALLTHGHANPMGYLRDDCGIREVVLKHGVGGSTVHGPDGVHHEAALTVDAVDTVGAGDAFAAGYLSGLLDGVSIPERVRRGTAAGAFAVSTEGDWEGAPSRADLELLSLSAGEALR